VIDPLQVHSPKQILLRSPTAQALAAFCVVLLLSLVLSPSDSKTLKLQSVLLQVFLVLAVPLGLASWLGLEKRGVFHLRPTSVRNLFWCVLLTFCCLFLLDEIALWQHRLIGVSANLSPEMQQLLRGDSISSLVWVVFSLALVPAACEEFLFRGFILSRFLSAGNLGHALMMTAVLFGFFHRNLAVLLTTSLAGLLLAFVVWRTGSLYNAIAMHALVNGWAISVTNSRLAEWLPWLEGASHVPLTVQVLCAAGTLLAARKLNQPPGRVI
jgi:sodium transport system permease protein